MLESNGKKKKKKATPDAQINHTLKKTDFSFEFHTHLRRDPILENVLITAGKAAPNLSRSTER